MESLRWAREQILAVRMALLVPLLQKRGLQLIEREADSFELPNFKGLSLKRLLLAVSGATLRRQGHRPATASRQLGRNLDHNSAIPQNLCVPKFSKTTIQKEFPIRSTCFCCHIYCKQSPIRSSRDEGFQPGKARRNFALSHQKTFSEAMRSRHHAAYMSHGTAPLR